MSSQSRSVSGGRSKSKQKSPERHKLFVTNLDGSANEKDLEEQLRKLFESYGKVQALTVRKSKNGEYSFGFVEYQQGFDAQKAVDNLNGQDVKGKPMKVQFQDNSKRRKDPDKGCYTCGKMGHFARQCHSKNGSRAYRGRSRSRQRSKDKSNDRRKKRNRSPSDDSSQRDRARHKKRKERKDRSRDKDQKKKKKHKKPRGSSSDS